MIKMEDGRPIRVVVTGVRGAGSPETYVVDMMIDGMARSFEFAVAPRSFFSLSTEREFDNVFQQSLGVGGIVEVVYRYHKGEPIDFPVDIGEVLDFKHLLATGGPPPESGATGGGVHEPDPDGGVGG